LYSIQGNLHLTGQRNSASRVNQQTVNWLGLAMSKKTRWKLKRQRKKNAAAQIPPLESAERRLREDEGDASNTSEKRKTLFAVHRSDLTCD